MIKKNYKDSKSILPNGKRGIILKEVITLVISVLCLIILFYLAFQLYGMLVKKSAFEQAKASLEQIVGTINKVEEGTPKTYLITAPKDWFIIVYTKGTESPLSCSGNNCICLCPAEDRDRCDKEGVCNTIGLDIVPMSPLKLTNILELQFVKTGNILNLYAKIYEKKEQR